jgi:hypothetical protein
MPFSPAALSADWVFVPGVALEVPLFEPISSLSFLLLDAGSFPAAPDLDPVSIEGVEQAGRLPCP